MFDPIIPCPYCGGSGALVRNSKTIVQGQLARNTYVRCRECNSRGQRFLYSEFERPLEAHRAAIAAWNRRI